ncbi:peptidoglycan-binding protein [Dyella japonica]|uniref:Peptidoglycan binding-like domain-containing protein n=1 Tax=Dyella japonica TaxID=231455 RepID=A0ABV2JW89_9GAMM
MWDQPVKDLGTDYIMIRDQFNRQEPDADAFTRRVFDLVKKNHPDWNLSEHITVTGHSLGGTHAQMMAARYGLGGMAVNPYGAIDLGFSIPEGQPANAPSFINHVRATDVVSAGNRHYGSVVGYATEQDIANLQFGGYLDAPNPAHPPNPLLAASLTAHFVNNFSPDPGGQTVMTEANEARYRQYQGAIEHYRHDVMAARLDLHDVLSYQQHPEQAQRLQNQVADAVAAATYHQTVQGVAHVSAIGLTSHVLEQSSERLHAAGEVTQASLHNAAAGAHDLGQALHRGADAAAHAAQTTGQGLDQVTQALAREAARAAPLSPGLALGALVSAQAGITAHAAGDQLGHVARDVAGFAQAVSGGVSQALDAAGDRLNNVLETAGQRAHEGSQQIEQRIQRASSPQAMHHMQEQLADNVHAVQHSLHGAQEAISRGFDTVDRRSNQATNGHEAFGIPVAPSALEPHRVQALQENLNALGLTDHRGQPLPTHGTYDHATRAAVAGFQHEHGLPATGQPDPGTLALAQAHAQLAALQKPAAALDLATVQATRAGQAPDMHRAEASTNPSLAARVDTPQASGQRPFSDPSHPQHALYSELKALLPKSACEERLAQLTVACHQGNIKAGQIESITLENKQATIVGLAGFARVDMTQNSPPLQQSLQQADTFNQQQAQQQRMREQSQAQIQAGPTLSLSRH